MKGDNDVVFDTAECLCYDVYSVMEMNLKVLTNVTAVLFSTVYNIMKKYTRYE